MKLTDLRATIARANDAAGRAPTRVAAIVQTDDAFTTVDARHAAFA